MFTYHIHNNRRRSYYAGPSLGGFHLDEFAAQIARERYFRAAVAQRDARQAYQQALAREQARRRRAELEVERALEEQLVRRVRAHLQQEAVARRAQEIEAAEQRRARYVEARLARRAEEARAREGAQHNEAETDFGDFFEALGKAMEAFVTGMQVEQPATHRSLGRVTPEPPRAESSTATAKKVHFDQPATTATTEPTTPADKRESATSVRVPIAVADRTPDSPRSSSSKGKRPSSPSSAEPVTIPAGADAPTALALIESALDARLASFAFPSQLDFAITASNNTTTAPALEYSATNAPLHAHTHALARLLASLDSVESGGEEDVRAARRRVVRRVEDALNDVDRLVREAWAARVSAAPVADIQAPTLVQTAAGGATESITGFIVDEPALAPRVVASTPPIATSVFAADATANPVREVHPQDVEGDAAHIAADLMNLKEPVITLQEGADDLNVLHEPAIVLEEASEPLVVDPEPSVVADVDGAHSDYETVSSESTASEDESELEREDGFELLC